MSTVYGETNWKGGVGKTTSTVQFGYELAKRGKRVLIIDGDSQRSATKYLGLEPKPGRPTFYAVMTEAWQAETRLALRGVEDSPTDPRVIVAYTGTATHPVRFSGNGCLHLIPGAKQITDAPVIFDKSRDRQPVPTFDHVLPFLMQRFLGWYEYILLDPSPSQDRVNKALSYAAQYLIAPVAAEPMAMDGLQELLESTAEMNQARAGLRLEGQTRLAGLLIAKVMPDQMAVVKDFQHALDQNGIPHFGQAYIPYTTAGWMAPSEHLPIAEYQQDDPAATAYRAIAAQL